MCNAVHSRTRCPGGLRSGSAASRLLGLGGSKATGE